MEWLDKYVLGSSNKPITHTSMSGGKYHVPQKKLKSFILVITSGILRFLEKLYDFLFELIFLINKVFNFSCSNELYDFKIKFISESYKNKLLLFPGV